MPPLLKDSPAEQQQQGQNSNTQPVGTGFVNIGRYLAANQGLGQDVKGLGDNLLKSENDRIYSATNNTRNAANYAMKQMPTALNATSAENLVNSGASIDQMGKYFTPGKDVAHMGQIDFSGNNANVLGGLGNVDTVGRAINQYKNPNATGGYTPNIEAIDRALYGGTADVRSTSKNIGNAVQGQRNAANVAVQGANQAVDNANKANADRRENNKNAFRSAAGDIVSKAQAQADAANAADSAAMQHQWNPGGGMTSVWKAGTGQAQAQNFLGQSGQNSLAQISKLLGDPSLAMKSDPSYQRGQWVATMPGATANQPESFTPGPNGTETYQPGSIGTPQEQAQRMLHPPVDQYGHPITFS